MAKAKEKELKNGHHKDKERAKDRDKDKVDKVDKVKERDVVREKERVPAKDEKREKEREKERAEREKERLKVASMRSPYPADELVKWRQLLLAKRSELSSDIAGLVKDAMEAEDGHTTPNHIAERGSDADLQDMSLGVVGEEEAILWQIDRALRKIERSSPLPYGLCEYSKTPIAKSRLQLLPWTPLSIEGAQYMEENHLTLEDMLLDD